MRSVVACEREKWGRVRIEEEMREMGERGMYSGGGEVKRKGRGYVGGGEKK